jgi:UDP-3-O-[3-hydroxymyristoyl] glucosamine N-acyltransferase
MAYTLEHIAAQLSAELRGDGSALISGGQSLENAREGEMTFVSDKAHAYILKRSQASAVLVGRALCETPEFTDIPQAVLIVDDAKIAFLKVLGMFAPPRKRMNMGISSHATVHPSARIGLFTNVYPGVHIDEDVVIGEHCDIHPGVCIGAGCRIADGVMIFPNAVLYHDVRIGNRVIIHAGAVIGSDGFGYQLVEGGHQKLHHYGTVRLEDDVEIGANTTIDRALIGETVIGRGTKIDNLVQVAHNCQIGKHNILAGQVAMAGSVSTGDYVVFAGQVGIADHTHIGDRAILAAQAGVTKSLPGGKKYFGSPAQLLEETKKQVIAMRKLPKMREQIRELGTQIESIEDKLKLLSKLFPDADPNSSASAA